jgi:hypothetical protein
LQSRPVGDKRQPMPYALKLYLYLFVTGVVVVVLAVWLARSACSLIDLRVRSGLPSDRYQSSDFQQTERVVTTWKKSHRRKNC